MTKARNLLSGLQYISNKVHFKSWKYIHIIQKFWRRKNRWFQSLRLISSFLYIQLHIIVTIMTIKCVIVNTRSLEFKYKLSLSFWVNIHPSLLDFNLHLVILIRVNKNIYNFINLILLSKLSLFMTSSAKLWKTPSWTPCSESSDLLEEDGVVEDVLETCLTVVFLALSDWGGLDCLLNSGSLFHFQYFGRR